MQVIHYALYGYEYERVTPPNGATPHLRVVRQHFSPTETFCGLKVAQAPGKVVEVIGDHSDPRSCRECLRALPKRKTSSVQPVMWSLP